MTVDVVSSLHDAAGAAIPVEWVYAGAEAYHWSRDSEHWPSPMPPMESWLHKHALSGLDRAWEEAGMEPPAMFYRFQYAGPYLYARETPYEPERAMRNVLGYREVSRNHGGPMAFWQKYCRPRIERVCSELASASGDTPPATIAELYGYGFHQTFTSLVPLFEPAMRLGAMLGEAPGEAPPLALLEVLQGGDNATQEIDREIWELSDLARRTPEVARIISDTDEGGVLASLRQLPEAARFVTAFDALIQRHGSRSLGWELVLPTWRERPEAPLSLVKAQLASGSVDPAEVAAGSAQRRRAALEAALAQLPADKHEEFSKIVALLDGYVPLREDRAYWQMVLTGEVRGALLRIGARLTAGGAIDRAGDVLFLEPQDIEGGTAGDLRARVTERTSAWERWRGVVPPPVIGTAQPAPAEAPAASGQLRGSAASRGIVTGPARIIHTPEEGAVLRRGDILVCVMSTPAWTPLFGIVAGIISETGGALSHPAITAREYGIPAVVAVKGATEKIRDGQIVTVDGSAGTISFEP